MEPRVAVGGSGCPRLCGGAHPGQRLLWAAACLSSPGTLLPWFPPRVLFLRLHLPARIGDRPHREGTRRPLGKAWSTEPPMGTRPSTAPCSEAALLPSAVSSCCSEGTRSRSGPRVRKRWRSGAPRSFLQDPPAEELCSRGMCTVTGRFCLMCCFSGRVKDRKMSLVFLGKQERGEEGPLNGRNCKRRLQ